MVTQKNGIGVLAALGLLGAACTAGAPPASAPQSTPVSAAAGSGATSVAASQGSSASDVTIEGLQVGEHLKLGLMVPTSGNYASLGIPAKAIIQLEQKRLNDEGGMDGHPIDLIIEEDNSDPNMGVVVFKQMLDEHPVALLGPVNSTTTGAIEPLVQDARLPEIAAAADQTIAEPVRKYTFIDGPPTGVATQHLLSYLQQTHITRVGVMHDPGASPTAGLNALKKYGPQFGVQIVDDEPYNLTDTDMTTQITKIKNNSDVQFFVNEGAGGPQVIIAKETAALGLNVPRAFIIHGDKPFIDAAGSAAEGVYSVENKIQLHKFLPTDDPSKAILDEMVPEYQNSTGKGVDEFVANAYDALHMMLNAIHAARSTDPDKIVDAIEHLKYDGAAGHYEYAADNHYGMADSAFAVNQIKNGEQVPVTPNCAGCFQTSQPAT